MADTINVDTIAKNLLPLKDRAHDPVNDSMRDALWCLMSDFQRNLYRAKARQQIEATA